MTHFNRFTDRRIVEDLLLSGPAVGFGFGVDHAIDCHEWNEISSGWNPTAPFSRCVWTRTGKVTPLFTEHNLEAVLEQRRRAMEAAAVVPEEPRAKRPLPRQDSWIGLARRGSHSGSVVPLREAKLRPELLGTPREALNSAATPSPVLRRQLASRPPPEPPAPVCMPPAPSEGSELVLPPIELPLVSLSLNLEKLSEKMSWWDEEIRRDVQAKADARNRAKLESLAASDEEATLAGDLFSIKSLLHSCTLECDCQRYPDLAGPTEGLSSRLRSRFATNVALKRVAKTSRPPLPHSVTPPALRGSSGGSVEAEGEAKESGSSGPESKNGSGFCSNALGQPKVREAKSIPSIPTTDCTSPGAVALTGKRLQVASTR